MVELTREFDEQLEEEEMLLLILLIQSRHGCIQATQRKSWISQREMQGVHANLFRELEVKDPE